MARRNDIDWEAIERDYRITTLSANQKAQKHKCSVSAITRRADKEQWTRNLTEVVNAVADAKVREAIVEEAKQKATDKATESKTVALSDIEFAASVNAEIILRQQKRTRRLASLLETMTDELEEITSKPLVLEEVVIAVGQQDERAAQAINRLRHVGTRLDSLKTAAEINTKVQDSERKAHGLDKDAGEDKVGALLALLRAHASK
jgi:hypothetical protein